MQDVQLRKLANRDMVTSGLCIFANTALLVDMTPSCTADPTCCAHLLWTTTYKETSIVLGIACMLYIVSSSGAAGHMGTVSDCTIDDIMQSVPKSLCYSWLDVQLCISGLTLAGVSVCDLPNCCSA